MASSGQEICFCFVYYLEYKLLLCSICQRAILVNPRFKLHFKNYIKEIENPISSKVQLEIINKCSSLNILSLEESLDLILKNKEFISPFKELELLKDLYFCRFQDCSKVLKKKEEGLLKKSKVLDYNPLIDKLSPFQIRTQYIKFLKGKDIRILSDYCLFIKDEKEDPILFYLNIILRETLYLSIE
jgi:hypothetical protein